MKLAAALLGLGLSACASESPSPRPAALRAEPAEQLSGRIAYVSEHDGRRTTRALDLASGAASELSCGASECYPAAAGSLGLVLIGAEGGESEAHREALAWLPRAGQLRPLGFASGKVRNPTLMPDASAVVVEADRDGFRDLYLVPLGGAAPERLTDAPAGSFEPALSPSGAELVFVSSRDGDAEIYRMSLRDRSIQRLTWSRGDDAAPQWTADGSEIVYVSHRRGLPTLYRMRADGSRPRPIAPPAAGVLAQHEAAIAADGRIAFVEQMQGGAQLRVLSKEGTSLIEERGDSPAWSPDGRTLAFVSDRDGEPAVWALGPSGKPRRLTGEPGAEWLPRWIR